MIRRILRRLSSESVVYLLLFGWALLLRVAVAFELRDLPTAIYLVMDARHYDHLAREILAGQWLPSEPFYQAPLYPYFLATVYSVFGPSYLIVRLVQALAGALAALVLGLATRRAFGRTAGVVAFLLGAWYGPQVFYTQPLLKPALVSLLLATFVLCSLRSGGGLEDRPAFLVLSGVSLGLAVLLRENFLVLVPAMLLALIWSLRSRPRRRLARAVLLFGSGFAAMLLPAAWANHHASGQWLLVSSQGGMNFFIGNYRGASGFYRALSSGSHAPVSQRQDAEALAATIKARELGVEELDEPLDEGEISRVFWRESLRQVNADIPGWIALMARKSLYFWNRYEVPDAEGYYVAREHSQWLRLAIVDFGLVAPLAMFGLALASSKDAGAAAFCALMALAVFASVAMFFIFARYRLPVVVFLLPLAGLGVARLAEVLRGRYRHGLVVALLVLAAAVAVVWYPAFGPDRRDHLSASLYFNLGVAANYLSDREYQLLLHASDAAQSNLHWRNGSRRARQAVDYLERAAPEGSSLAIAWIEKGVAQQRLGNFLLVGEHLDEAHAAYRSAYRSLRYAQGLEIDDALREQVVSVIEVVESNLRLSTAGRKD